MVNVRSLLDRHLGANSPAAGEPQQGGFSLDQLLTGRGGLATGAVAGGLAGLLLGGAKPKKIARTALTAGGVALVGGLAYKAWRDWQAKRTPAPAAAETPLEAPAGGAFLPDAEPDRRDLARALTRAMIAAAKADGHVTPEERERIMAQLQPLDMDQSDRGFVEAELAGPLDVNAVARDGTTPERAAEIYTASLLAIDPDGEAERAYLALLAARLRLDPDLVAHIHANAAGPL